MRSSNSLPLTSSRFAVALLVGLAAIKPASAQVSVATDPVGFTTTPLLASSDTYVSIPFTRPPEFIGAITSASSSNSAGSITVVGNPWTAHQFAYGSNNGAQHNHYYALIGPISGASTKEGHTYPVMDNDTGTLTVDTSHNDLNIPANTQVEVIPYWTPITIFPATDANVSFTPTTSSALYKTQVRVPNYSASGINNPPSSVYFFSNNVDGTSNNVGWRIVGDKTTDHGDDPLLPDGYFVVRNDNGAPELFLTNIGVVLLKKLAVSLTALTQPQGQQDNPVSMVRPVNVALDATGLNPADGSFGPGDQLLLFDNTQAAFNKTPATYTYDTHWRLSGDATLSDRGADIIPPGTGFIVRKVAGGQTAFWTNAFPVSAVSAVSRKGHGSAGTFDIQLPLGGTPGIECRSGGATQVVFTFPVAVTINAAAGAQGAQVTSGAGTINSVTGSGTTTVTVNLTTQTNAQWITVTLIGVSDGINTNDVAVRAGLLLGDVTANGVVTNTDVGAVKAQVNPTTPVTQANFRDDVTVNGFVTNTDVGLVKGQVNPTGGLPSPP